MSNELAVKKTWLQNNWKWLLPTLLGILLYACFFTSTIAEDTTSIIQAYSDTLLYEKAIEKANKNREVLAVIGRIEPIDKLSIMEGNVLYTNHNNSVATTVRIIGVKEIGKIDIIAHKMNKEWHYQKITIRLKKQKATINVLDQE
ncbi:hypothetical protein SGQ44_00900 [Flavobacterium sp. Fl-77]|uniref:Cytochrome oxidase complex assembly protein 1 n=1 Tax=Flavobacterium flavipigmentatum TaxID=2893884 RepID=A0AAJ2SD31_9FLAO|nr:MULTISPECIES: cytochrome c oxidase assembly factor Coa1 family protein [unclassified Flavobacterium]MDX6180691.1 hypothetical protein [Flavobacterium sp. Fl-33]MDX6184291.1 hypothetical protein [Flavobacterium sp. Fl-77]UFH39402.1 hypothetical protein LNP22_03800 [Flavobacterium sp. F-70]